MMNNSLDAGAAYVDGSLLMAVCVQNALNIDSQSQINRSNAHLYARPAARHDPVLSDADTHRWLMNA